MRERVVILLDGGFVKKKLQAKLKRFPGTADVVRFCAEVMQKPRLSEQDLLRVYYYDAPPLSGIGQNPIDGNELAFETTPEAARNRKLIDSLDFEPDFAVRRGQLVFTGWKLGKAALKNLSMSPRVIEAKDLIPDISQKGVDIRIGLDIATIAIKRLAAILVLVTGDSDFVPAMKLARKEGMRVYLECMGHGVRAELKAHADFVL